MLDKHWYKLTNRLTYSDITSPSFAVTTEEEDVMIEGRLMRGEVSGEGQGHLVLEALVELEVVQEVRGTEAGQGHIVGHDPGPDLDQGHGASQGQDLGRGKVRF